MRLSALAPVFRLSHYQLRSSHALTQGWRNLIERAPAAILVPDSGGEPEFIASATGLGPFG